MIYLIRHAESESNAGGKTASAKDTLLTEKGVQQSMDLLQRISEKPDLIVVSPYLRTQQTAAPFIKKYAATPVEMWNVQEFTYLETEQYDGTTQVERKVMTEAYLLQNDPDLVRGPGAESFKQMLQRVDELFDRLKKMDSNKFVVIFSHVRFMRAVLARNERKTVTFDDVFGASAAVINNTDVVVLDVKSDAAEQLLRLCSVFNDMGIDKRWFAEAIDCLPETLQNVVGDEERYNEVVHALVERSLISLDSEGLIVMCREVQERIRADMKGEQSEWFSCCVKVLSRLANFEVVSEADKTRFYQLLGHIWPVTKELIEKGAIKEVVHLIRFLRYGYGAVHLYRLERWRETTLDTGEKMFGKGEPDMAATCDLIAWSYFMRMDDDEDVKSLEWYHKALAIREKELSSDHPDIAVNCNHIARVYHELSRYKEAEEWYRKALGIAEKAFGKAHYYIAVVYSNMAELYQWRGMYDMALEWFHKALELYKKVSAKDHLRMATAYNDIAYVHILRKDLDNILKWYRKELAVYAKMLSDEQADSVTVYNRIILVYDEIAQAYTDIEEHNKALKWYLKTLDVEGRILNRPHFSSYVCIADAYMRLDKSEEAMAWYQKGLDLPETDINAYEMIRIYHDMARTCDYLKKDYENALKWYQKELDAEEKEYGKAHLNVAKTNSYMARVYLILNDYENALAWYHKTLAVYDEMLDMEKADVVSINYGKSWIYDRIALIFKNRDEHDSALEWYQKKLDVCEKLLNAERIDKSFLYQEIASVYDEMAGIFSRKNVHDTATAYRRKKTGFYKKAALIIEDKLAKNEGDKSDDRDDLAVLYGKIAWDYNAKDKYKIALEWFHKELAVYKDKLTETPSGEITCYNDMAYCYYHIAGVYDDMNEFDKSVENLHKASEICDRALAENRSKNIRNTYSFIAWRYNNTAYKYRLNKNDYKKAFDCCQKAWVIYTKIKNTEGLSEVYGEMAEIYSCLGEHKNAVKWYRKRLKFCTQKYGDEDTSTGFACSEMARFYEKNKEFEYALYCYFRAFFIYNRNNANSVQVYRNMKSCYAASGNPLSFQDWMNEQTGTTGKYDVCGEFDEGLAIVQLNGKYGCIDITGKETVPLKYDKICKFINCLTGVHWAKVQLNGKYGFIDKTGREVIPVIYDNVWYCYGSLLNALLDGDFDQRKDCGFIPLCRDYDDSKSLGKGLVRVQLNGKKGFLDLTGKEVAPIKYDVIGFFDEGLAEVRLDGKKGFINPAGEEVVQLKEVK